MTAKPAFGIFCQQERRMISLEADKNSQKSACYSIDQRK